MIKEIKIALMETNEGLPEEELIGDAKYTIRSSCNFFPAKYWEENYRDVTPIEKTNIELFDNFLKSSLSLIFEDLKSQTHQEVDAVGLWIDTGELKLEIAMDLETLNNMAVYGDNDVIPIFELLQMAILKEEKS
jgi:hypothetical protein